MKQRYKDTFNQITIDEATDLKLLNLINHQTSQNHRTPLNHRKLMLQKNNMRRFVFMTAVIIFLLLPTCTVIAFGTFDFKSIFRNVFGEKSELILEYASKPEIVVVQNTFQDIDIEIAGIVGDSNLMYIILEVSKKEGKFVKGDYSFHGAFSLKEHRKFLNVSNKMNSVSYYQIGNSNLRIDQYWRRLDDSNPTDEKLTLVFLTNMIKEGGEEYFASGKTCSFVLENLYLQETIDSIGKWEIDFTMEYKEAKSIVRNVNKLAKMPNRDVNKIDHYIYDYYVESIQLTPIALRWKGGLLNPMLRNSWDTCIYIEMLDGTRIGYKNYKDYIDFRMKGQNEKISTIHNNNVWILDEPIDMNKVKSIHFGNLKIDMGENEYEVKETGKLLD